MPSRDFTTWNNGEDSYKLRSYWMLKANGSYATAMAGGANGIINGSSFDNDMDDTNQRWLILSADNGITSGIKENVIVDKTKTESIFNLAGQKLAVPQKGLNIVGGKKVFVK